MAIEWITTAEAAKLTGYHVEAIRRLIRQGKVTANKRGRDWWVDKIALDLFLQEAELSKDKRRGPKIRN